MGLYIMQKTFWIIHWNYGWIATDTCMIELTGKDEILLSDAALILYKAGLRTILQDIHINFTLSGDNYSIVEFNAKVKAVVLMQRQDWEVLQIKDSKIFVPENYTFLTSNIAFIVLV